MSNKLFYTLIVFGAIILMGAGVWATTSPGISETWYAGEIPNPGHSIQDVASPSGCVSGQYLKYNTESAATGPGYWTCATPSSGTTTTAYVKQGHFGSWSNTYFGYLSGTGYTGAPNDLVIGNTARNDHNYDLEVLGQGKMLISSGDTAAGGSGVIYFPKDGSFYLREAGTNADSAYGENSVTGAVNIFRAWATGNKVGANNYCDISGANCFKRGMPIYKVTAKGCYDVTNWFLDGVVDGAGSGMEEMISLSSTCETFRPSGYSSWPDCAGTFGNTKATCNNVLIGYLVTA
jgi:hypothetical protein